MSAAEPDSLTAVDADTARAWNALLSAGEWTRQQKDIADGGTYGLDPSGRLTLVAANLGLLVWHDAHGWSRSAHAPPAVAALLDLYLPICNVSPTSPLTVGHLGQGLDGYIATGSGDSNYVTGPENLLHLHRMRALCDAVMVGAQTVATDDPRLTTRRTTGDNPVRVILDPHRRLAPTHRVFTDKEAPTLLVCDEARASDAPVRVAAADVLGVPLKGGRFDLTALIGALHSRNLISVFIEGGGHTVSAFLEAGRLDRIQIAVAPLITGVGRPGVRLTERKRMKECLRPPHRIFSMGDDILFDCNLRSDSARSPGNGGLSRIL